MANQRRHDRIPWRVRVRIEPTNCCGPIDGHTTDISLGGVGMAVRGTVAVGLPVAIHFALVDADGREATETAAGQVVRSRAGADGPFVAVEFYGPLRPSYTPLLVRRITGP